MKNFLNPKGHQNCIGGSKVSAILHKALVLKESICTKHCQVDNIAGAWNCQVNTCYNYWQLHSSAKYCRDDTGA